MCVLSWHGTKREKIGCKKVGDLRPHLLGLEDSWPPCWRYKCKQCSNRQWIVLVAEVCCEVNCFGNCSRWSKWWGCSHCYSELLLSLSLNRCVDVAALWCRQKDGSLNICALCRLSVWEKGFLCKHQEWGLCSYKGQLWKVSKLNQKPWPCLGIISKSFSREMLLGSLEEIWKALANKCVIVKSH